MSLSFAVTISDDCGAVGAAFGAGEQPALAPKCKSAKGFGGMFVRQIRPLPRQRAKSSQRHVIDWLSNRGRARRAGSLLPQPCFQGSKHKYELDLLRQRSLSA
jgi:hypothetical protein